MACQLSKPFVCCALELTSPTFSQPKPAAPPCPQFSAAFFIPILLWVHLFFFLFCWVFWFFPNAPSFFFEGNRLGMERQRDNTQLLRYAALLFLFFFIFIFFGFLGFSFSFLFFFYDFISVRLVIFHVFFFLFFILSRLFWLPCLSPLFLLRLSRHGRWLINHVAASIEKPSPVVSDAVPLFRLPFPAFCRLARSSCFPESTGTRERNKKWQNKTKTRKFPSPHKKKLIWNVFILFVKKKIIFKKKGSSNSKKKWGGGGGNKQKKEWNKWLRSLLAAVVGTGRDVVSFPIRQHISRHFTIGRILFFFT